MGNLDPMKMSAIFLIGIFVLALGDSVLGQNAEEKKKINWLDIETAQEKLKDEPKKLIVDVYTTWCGWCKKMDAGTFSHPVIVDYINEHYYAVKLNAESKKEITFNGVTYKNPNPGGRRSTHELASIAAVNGRLGYPTIVYIDEELNLITQVASYMDAKTLEPVIHFFAEEAYKTMSYEDFTSTFISDIGKPKIQ